MGLCALPQTDDKTGERWAEIRKLERDLEFHGAGYGYDCRGLGWAALASALIDAGWHVIEKRKPLTRKERVSEYLTLEQENTLPRERRDLIRSAYNAAADTAAKHGWKLSELRTLRGAANLRHRKAVVRDLAARVVLTTPGITIGDAAWIFNRTKDTMVEIHRRAVPAKYKHVVTK